MVNDFNDRVLKQIFKVIDELYFRYRDYDEKLCYGRLKGLCDCYRSALGNNEPLGLTSLDYKKLYANDDDDYDD